MPGIAHVYIFASSLAWRGDEFGWQVGTDPGLDAQEVAHFYDIVHSDFAGLVGPAVADVIDHFGNVGIAEHAEFRHAEGHAVVWGVRHAAAAHGDLQHRIRMVGKYSGVTVQRQLNTGGSSLGLFSRRTGLTACMK